MEYLIATIIGLAILVGIVSGLINIYNRIVFLNNNVDKSFANIDVLLKQRADEIPNVIRVVKQSTKYEENMLIRLTDLRTSFLSAQKTDEKIAIANEMTQALKTVFAVSENYPQLQGSQSFIELQKRVSQIEDNIADRREFYNESIALYNTGIQEFPNVILAKIMGYTKRHLLEISEAEKAYEGIKF